MLNEIRQIIYSLYRAKEITKRELLKEITNNTRNLIKLSNSIGTIFMNSGNSKAPNPHILLLNLSDKINLKKVINMLLYQILEFTVWKSHTKTINLKYQLQHEIENLNYLIDHTLYQIFKIILNISLKKREKAAENPSIRLYVNETENRITFRIKTVYYLKILTPETMKLLGNTKSETTKDKNGKNVPHLEITQVVLIHCNIVKNDY